MIKLWIDRETVKLFISSGQTEVKNHGYDCRGKKYVTIFETEFTADDHLNENPLWWAHDIHESPLEAAPPDPKLPVTRISLRDSFPGNPCRNRGIYKLGTATAELERRERTDEFWGEIIMTTNTLSIWAEGSEVTQMFNDLSELWLAIKTGQLSKVTMTHSYENEATEPKTSEEVED